MFDLFRNTSYELAKPQDKTNDYYVAAACRPAAELASFWNKPLVTWVATSPEFNDKTVFTTMGRTLGPFSKMGIFLVEVFQQYNWRKVVILSSNYFVWKEAGTAFRKVCIQIQ